MNITNIIYRYSRGTIIVKLLFYYFLYALISCPFLFSQNKLDVIVIDAGHGGKDPGTIGDKTGVYEKNIVLPISQKLGEMIGKKYPSVQIVFTRKSDEFVDLKERTRMANEMRAKLFISIHANHKKPEETDKNGFEVYILSRERFGEAVSVTMNENKIIPYKQSSADSDDSFIFSSLAQAGYNRFNEYFASSIELNFLNFTQAASRGVLQAGFWVIIGASMPAVLIETGYLSDINDEKYLSSEKGQNDVALALFNAFQSYKLIYESQ